MPALVFPSSDALRAALGAGLIPPAIAERKARFLREQDGSVVVVPEARLSRQVSAALREAGVASRRGKLAGLAATREVGCWAEIIPPRWVGEDALDTRLALFALEEGEELLKLAGELLRLGCDRQELALFAGQGPRALLRAVAPPYYVVARALEEEGAARLFLPVPGKEERVFCQAGFHHPLLEQVQPPARGLLLMTSSGSFVPLPEVEFEDIYQRLQVDLPEGRNLKAQPLSRSVEVPLELVTGMRTRAATLWIISDHPAEQVDALVSRLPEDEASRLMVALTERDGRRLVLLRARMDGRAPLALDLPGEGCAPLLGVDNLYLPDDAVFEPPLRRATLREILAPDLDCITFVTRRGPGPRDFRIERIAAAAFEPLGAWVDYVIDQGAEQLSAWVRSATFDLSPFVSTGLEWGAGRAVGESPVVEGGPGSRPTSAALSPPAEALAAPLDPPEPVAAIAELSFAPVATLELGPAGKELAQLEERFINLDAAADEAERSALWIEMAQLNARLSRERDAGLCWTRALWQSEGAVAAALARAWSESETALARRAPQEILSLGSATAGQARAVAAWIHATESSGVGGMKKELLRRVSSWLDEHDHGLDVRSLWLARSALARLTGDDSLLLARTRERVLLRLRRGLSLQQDVPSFLRRGAGERGRLAAERLSSELEHLLESYGRTKRTRSAVEAPEAQTRAYVHLVFAFAFARLGEGERAAGLMGGARQTLDLDDEIHAFLCDAFCARIEQALEGLSFFSALPPRINARLNALPRFSRYKVDRLRQASMILEAQERLDPVAGFQRNEVDPRGAEFGPLRELAEPEAIAAAVSGLIERACSASAPERARLFDGAMDFFAHLQEGQAVPLLRRIIGAVDEIEPSSRFELLEEALMLSGLFGRQDLAREAASALQAQLLGLGVEQLPLIAGSLGRVLRSLRRVGLDELSSEFLGEVERLAQGDTVAALLARMQLAAGLADMGEQERATALLANAQKAADKARLAPSDQMRFLRAVAEAMSHLPIPLAMGGIRSLAKRLSGISDSFNTNSHFCLSVVQFIEALVLGIASEALLIDERGRRILDEDEYAVRRRIARMES